MKFFEKYYLYLTVFVTGAVILVLEILGTRIVAPYYGTTIYAWSSLIGVTLMALSLGYYSGGRLADRKPKVEFLYSIVFLAALSIVVIPLIMDSVLVGVNFLGPRFGALMSAALLFAVPLFLLGMVSPYAIKLKTKDMERVGVTAGNLYGVATVGSFVGAILAGFYLIPNLGINSITYLMGGLLVLVVAPYGVTSGKKLFSVGVVLMFLLVVMIPQIMSADVSDDDVRVIYETESPYASLKVVDYDINPTHTFRYLLVDGATHTEYDLEKKEFNFNYLRLLEKIKDYRPDAKSLLVVGLGGGGIEQKFEGFEIDTVELDPKVVDIAREYFDFEGDVIIDDGRHYIKNTDKKYDLIALDVFNGYSIASNLLTKEAFTETKAVLPEDGILVINSHGWDNDELSKSIYKTLSEVFDYVYVKAMGYGHTNIIYYASDAEISLDRQFITLKMTADEDTIILTDDYNPADTMNIANAEAFRENTMEHLNNVAI